MPMSPFEAATRQNITKLTTLAFQNRGRSSFDLPRVGLLANLFLRVEGTLTVTPGTGTVTLNSDQYGKPFGLIDRLTVKTNNSTSIVDVSGQGLYVRNLIDDNAYLDVLAANLPEAESTNPTFQFSTTSGANALQFTLKVPIVANERDLLGLILLQNPQTLVSVGIDWADVASLFTLTNDAAVSFSGNAHLTMEYFDVPADKQNYPNLAIVHTLIEDSTAIDGTGTTNYVVKRGNIYQRLLHRFVLNGAPASADDIERIRLQYNQNITPYNVDGKDQLAIQRLRYKRDLPKGVFAWDFSYQGMAGFGGGRDLVNSAQITELLSRLDIASGATLGTNNNKVFTLSEQLMPLQ